MAVKDLERVTDELATACWAREARVIASRAQAALVIVDIVRRDPLTSTTALTPSVLDGVDLHLVDDDGIVVPLPDRSDLAPDAVPAPRVEKRAPRSTSPNDAPVSIVKSTRKPAPADEESNTQVTGFGGVDVSDYV